jgi:solute:Na+ symporter, SSS family
MGDLYGNKVRVITAIAGTIGATGVIAMQFKVFGSIFAYFINIPAFYSIIISGAIATIYSAFGGIRSVTFTDILQAMAFGVIIPMLGFAIWGHFYNTELTIQGALADPKFDLKLLFDSSNNSFWEMVFMFLYFSLPAVMLPSSFQRVAMGSNLEQVKKAFLYSGIIFIAIKISITWIPFLVYSMNPNIQSEQMIPFIVDNYSYNGLKGFIVVAIAAFVMSTADSDINSSSVLFTHDIYGVFVKNRDNELIVARIFSCLLGVGTIFLSLVETDLLGLIIFSNSFYVPLVGAPFLLAIFGFRSSSLPVLIGMVVGLIATTGWKFLPVNSLPVAQNVIGVFFAMICNAIFLIGSHYILRQPSSTNSNTQYV